MKLSILFIIAGIVRPESPENSPSFKSESTSLRGFEGIAKSDSGAAEISKEGFLEGDMGCRGESSSCSSSEPCCRGLRCKNIHPRAGDICRPACEHVPRNVGSSCSNDDDCCGGEDLKCTTLGTCCITLGNECESDNDCCWGGCVLTSFFQTFKKCEL
ncbi:hypothetical protein ACHAWF_010890 [Thalassiosira exigua]